MKTYFTSILIGLAFPLLSSGQDNIAAHTSPSPSSTAATRLALVEDISDPKAKGFIDPSITQHILLLVPLLEKGEMVLEGHIVQETAQPPVTVTLPKWAPPAMPPLPTEAMGQEEFQAAYDAYEAASQVAAEYEAGWKAKVSALVAQFTRSIAIAKTQVRGRWAATELAKRGDFRRSDISGLLANLAGAAGPPPILIVGGDGVDSPADRASSKQPVAAGLASQCIHIGGSGELAPGNLYSQMAPQEASSIGDAVAAIAAQNQKKRD